MASEIQRNPARDARGARVGALRRVVAACGLVAGALLACQLGPGLVVTGDPPDLARVPQERIRSSMWVLAGEIVRLDELLVTPHDEDDPRLREKVLGSLDRMKAAARALDTPGRSDPAHPVLGAQLQTFLQRLERAERAVQRNPPDYYRASALAGGCFLCHGSGGTMAARR